MRLSEQIIFNSGFQKSLHKVVKWSYGRMNKASASEAVDSEFHAELGHTTDLEIAIHNFLAWCSVLEGESGEQTGKFACAVGKDTKRGPLIFKWWT